MAYTADFEMADDLRPTSPSATNQKFATAASRRPRAGLSVFSGGTAANFLVDVFDQITAKRNCPLRYIIPISDNGGSSSELIRVLGGPSKLLEPPSTVSG